VPPGGRDNWDKADVILKPVGGLLTALAVAWIGYSVNTQQAADTNVRLYAELLGRREEADTNLRKDMFNTAIKSFGESMPVTLERRVLDLELLAYNFHESIDLGPIFRDVYTRIMSPETTRADRERYRERVERLAKDVVDKEIATLEVHGKLDADLFFSDLPKEGSTVIDGTLPAKPVSGRRAAAWQRFLGLGAPDSPVDAFMMPERHFKVTVLRVNKERREMRVLLEVRTPERGTPPGGTTTSDGEGREAQYVHATFWAGFADFPMIDNTRLSEGYRCAIVLRKFDELQAAITLVYFPTSRAALKEKPYYDEMMEDLLRARRRVAARAR
jgi:hypothetical protein